jgi:hypothetical protein
MDFPHSLLWNSMLERILAPVMDNKANGKSLWLLDTRV